MEDDFKFPEGPRSDREWWRSCDCLEGVCEFFSFVPDVEGLVGLLGAAAVAAVALAAVGVVILVASGLFWVVLAFLCLVVYTVFFLALKTVVNAEGEYEGNWFSSMVRGTGGLSSIRAGCLPSRFCFIASRESRWVDWRFSGDRRIPGDRDPRTYSRRAAKNHPLPLMGEQLC